MSANPQIVNYRYRKNGIGFTDSIAAISVRGSTISGRQVTSEDSGVYLLLAANKFGTANLTIKWATADCATCVDRAATCRITVHFGARITHAPSAIFADVGEHVVLECQAEGVPRRVGMVRWQKVSASGER